MNSAPFSQVNPANIPLPRSRASSVGSVASPASTGVDAENPMSPWMTDYAQDYVQLGDAALKALEKDFQQDINQTAKQMKQQVEGRWFNKFAAAVKENAQLQALVKVKNDLLARGKAGLNQDLKAFLQDAPVAADAKLTYVPNLSAVPLQSEVRCLTNKVKGLGNRLGAAVGNLFAKAAAAGNKVGRVLQAAVQVLASKAKALYTPAAPAPAEGSVEVASVPPEAPADLQGGYKI